MVLSLIANLVLMQTGPGALLQELRDAVGAGQETRIQRLWARPSDASSLLDMSRRRGSSRGLRVDVIPTPPGWPREAGYWAVFSGPQMIQQDRDLVYQVIETADGLRIGREVPEWAPDPYRITSANLDVRLAPTEGRASFSTDLRLALSGKARALVFRQNLFYRLVSAKLDGTQATVATVPDGEVPAPQAGSVLKAGGLLIVWSDRKYERVEFAFTGSPERGSEDKITPTIAHLTAWWVPSIGRLPFTTRTRIVGPKGWVLQSEGSSVQGRETAFKASEPPGADEQAAEFRCDLPIAYPKVIAGRYVLAAELTDSGKTFRAYQLEPADKTRAEADVRMLAEGNRFFEPLLGPFPFKSYAVFDADTFYGIESYSYTLLRRDITTRFATHEMGHTYFGGLAPSAYTRDTWNEGVTMYVDSVLLGKNADRTLQQGLRTLDIPVPLNAMWLAWGNQGASYTRGAYVMKMLEAEIGAEKVAVGLRDIVKSRVGKETIWDDLRPSFERASGTDLGWFWRQWVDSAQFPSLTIASAETVTRDGSFTTYVKVRQTSASPMRLRFRMIASAPGQTKPIEVTLSKPEDEFALDTVFRPTGVSLDVFGLSLATVGSEFKLTAQKPATERQ